MVLGSMDLSSSSPTKSDIQTNPKSQYTYRECLKNHAASIGGHALDGCGEFMPSPSTIPSDPTSLKCAACGCHRNFHRRHISVPIHERSPSSESPSPTPSPHSPPPVSHLPPNSFFTVPMFGVQASRKRFRTKFSQDQKEKMYLFAEKIGWKMQRGDERVIDEFCRDIGVRKPVLKVWMHNNKHTLSIKHKNTLAKAPSSSSS